MTQIADILRASGWVAISVAGDHSDVICCVEAISNKLGRRVYGRGISHIETMTPTPKHGAHQRSLSKRHGLEVLPFHVELSHRMRPCRYVVFGCLESGAPSVATILLDRYTVDFSSGERALLRNAAVLVRSGRRSFYSTILPAGEEYLRFDTGCMEPVDDRGRAAIKLVEDRLAQCAPVYHYWQNGDVMVIDNWRVLHGRASAVGSHGRRLARIMIDG